MARKRIGNDNLNAKLLQDQKIQIRLLNCQIEHKNDEIKDFKQEALSMLKRIIDVGEANNCSNSKIAVRKMKEIAEESYKRIAIGLYDLELQKSENKIELPTTRESSK